MIEIDIKKELHGSDGVMQLNIATTIVKNEFVALSGKSGSGKTTLLRVLAGLESAEGTLKIDGEVWLDKDFSLAIQKREVGFVFQDYALFPNMSVEENLLFVKRDKELAKELLDITELTSLAKRSPQTLSGGQQQRVSLCRAMMNRPKILLMDEPLSALDPFMRMKLQNEILILHKKFDTTTIMVSHDPSEIYRLSSNVLVMENGSIIKEGKAKDILLKTNGTQKFSFEGEILDIKKVDVIYIAIISIGQQLVEVVISSNEVKFLTIGDRVRVGTKAFSPIIDLIS
ncbi:MAG: ABC transporter ATP-binding protein [Campylobacterota bacterium]|nr:ABC transporter ATP-binding protein [Campylobacterota bacterium]